MIKGWKREGIWKPEIKGKEGKWDRGEEPKVVNRIMRH